jgi:putative peptidoglycan lipid II flippase
VLQVEVGTILTRIFLIQILFYGLTGLANAFLNSRQTLLRGGVEPDPAER